MTRIVLIALVSIALTACNSNRRPNIPVQEPFPPVGLAATGAWLDSRNARGPQRIPASQIATEDICDIIDDC